MSQCRQALTRGSKYTFDISEKKLRSHLIPHMREGKNPPEKNEDFKKSSN